MKKKKKNKTSYRGKIYGGEKETEEREREREGAKGGIERYQYGGQLNDGA